MKRLALLLGLMAACSGCMQSQLRNHSVKLSTTTNDLIYEQVLNNLARTVEHPDEIPYFNMPASGTASIQQQLAATLTPQWALITTANSVGLGAWLFNQTQLAVTPTQIDQESWQLTTVPDPDRLVLMHCAYLKATGHETPDSERILHEYYSARDGWVDIAEEQVHFSNTVWAMSHQLVAAANEALACIPNDPKNFGVKATATTLTYDDWVKKGLIATEGPPPPPSKANCT